MWWLNKTDEEEEEVFKPQQQQQLQRITRTDKRVKQRDNFGFLLFWFLRFSVHTHTVDVCHIIESIVFYCCLRIQFYCKCKF